MFRAVYWMDFSWEEILGGPFFMTVIVWNRAGDLFSLSFAAQFFFVLSIYSQWCSLILFVLRFTQMKCQKAQRAQSRNSTYVQFNLNLYTWLNIWLLTIGVPRTIDFPQLSSSRFEPCKLIKYSWILFFCFLLAPYLNTFVKNCFLVYK